MEVSNNSKKICKNNNNSSNIFKNLINYNKYKKNNRINKWYNKYKYPINIMYKELIIICKKNGITIINDKRSFRDFIYMMYQNSGK